MPGRTLDGHDEWARRAAPGCRGVARLLRYQRSFAALESTKFGLSNLSGSKFHETVSWHWICGDWKVPLSDVGHNAIGGIAAIEKPDTCIIRRVPPLGRNRSRGLNNAEGLGTASRMRLRFDPCISSAMAGAPSTRQCVFRSHRFSVAVMHLLLARRDLPRRVGQRNRNGLGNRPGRTIDSVTEIR
jgi:hypothetical protein